MKLSKIAVGKNWAKCHHFAQSNYMDVKSIRVHTNLQDDPRNTYDQKVRAQLGKIISYKQSCHNVLTSEIRYYFEGLCLWKIYFLFLRNVLIFTCALIFKAEIPILGTSTPLIYHFVPKRYKN